MRHRNLVLALAVAVILAAGGLSFGAYHHMGETDAANFLATYPDKAGTKLDSCNLCHSGGSYQQTNKDGTKTTVTLGSCQWCHYYCGYQKPPQKPYADTLNSYGRDYSANGRSKAAIEAIKNLDSDGDGYSNQIEIAAVRYPGDPNDDPSKVAAPYRVFTLDQLEAMARHEQFLLMNTTKSGDYYAEYSGVPVSALLSNARMLSSGTGIKVYSPDGFMTPHPLAPDPNPSLYHVNGIYPQASFYYDSTADKANGGWCDYSAPSCLEHPYNTPIQNDGGLQLLLAFERDGQALTPGVLTSSNKLDGEGPFRVVPPQKNPGPPDQASTASNQNVIWPYDANADHNAGFSARSATIIKVEPLPAGTTDIDFMEAGWNYIDAKKIVVYGAIDPLPTIKEKMKAFISAVSSLDRTAFRFPLFKGLYLVDAIAVQKLINKGFVKAALNNLEQLLMKKTDGCATGQGPDSNDWITNCEAQKQTYWAAHEIDVLLKIAQ